MSSRILWKAAFVALTTVALSGQSMAQSALPNQYEGTINDYVQALGTTWLVSGEWSLQLRGGSGRGDFSASLTMFDTANPGAVAHTHHVVLTDGDVSINENWTTPGRFTLSGVGVVTGSGNLSFSEAPISIAITGGPAVTYSNVGLRLGGSAEGHFGSTPLGGVVNR